MPADTSDAEHVRQALQLLRRESDAFVADLTALSPADWDRDTTCPPWTVRQLAAHVVRQVDSYIGSVESGLRGEPAQPESREARAQRMNEIASWEPARVVRELAD